MSSASKSSRKSPAGRATKSAAKTSKHTGGSSKRSTSSTRGAAVRLLGDFARAMRRKRLRWYVFGAQAAVAYGRPRMTADVDVTVEVGEGGAPSLVELLSHEGFDLRFDLGDDFLRETRLLPLVHRSTAMPVDVVIAASSLHTELLERRRLVDVGGLRVPMTKRPDGGAWTWSTLGGCARTSPATPPNPLLAPRARRPRHVAEVILPRLEVRRVAPLHLPARAPAILGPGCPAREALVLLSLIHI